VTEPKPSKEELVALLSGSFAEPDNLGIGLEIEGIGLVRPSLAPMGLGSGSDLQGILRALLEAYGGRAMESGGVLHGIQFDDWNLTLEPGGQVEFSSPTARSFDELKNSIEPYQKVLDSISEWHDVRWVWQGIHPLYAPSEMPLLGKPRYKAMSQYMPTQAKHALRMMQTSASVQVSLDGIDPDDMMEKFQCMLRIVPLVNLLFANSPYMDGRATGIHSTRALIWRETEPIRCGIPRNFLNWDMRIEDYVEHVLDVPMFFIERPDGLVDLRGQKTFRQFYKDGFEGHQATLSDFETHLSTMFYEVRLKGFIEFRAVDCIPPSIMLSVPALLIGLIYDDASRKDLVKFLKKYDEQMISDAHEKLPQKGFAGRFGRHDVLGVCKDLVDLSKDGLERWAPDSVDLLQPVHERLYLGKTFAEELVARMGEDLRDKPPEWLDRLLETV
jgi:glutamate--cysteine ligase